MSTTPIISLIQTIVYDGDARDTAPRDVAVVPRVGDFVLTEHGVRPVQKVIFDYSNPLVDNVRIVVVID